MAPTINLGTKGGSMTITSPMYPNIYLDSSNCHWDFVTADPANVIKLTNIEWKVSFLVIFTILVSELKIWLANEKLRAGLYSLN